MKKRIVLVVLLSISLLLIVGCGKKNGTEETDTFTLTNDKDAEVTNFKDAELTFTYPKKMSFQTKKLEKIDEYNGFVFPYLEVYNPDYYFFMDLAFEENGKVYYDAIKREKSTAQGYKEYKWNNYEGFAYTESTYVYFYAVLEQDDPNFCLLLKGIGYSKNPYETLTEVFNEEDIQNVLNTMTYKKPE